MATQAPYPARLKPTQIIAGYRLLRNKLVALGMAPEEAHRDAYKMAECAVIGGATARALGVRLFWLRRAEYYAGRTRFRRFEALCAGAAQ